MKTPSQIAADLTRGWVRLYTTGMPAGLRETRCAEIDSDLWEHENDARENGVPAAVIVVEILLRTCVGIPDDLTWRFDAMQTERGHSRKRRSPMLQLSARQTRWLGLCGLVGGIVWAVDILYFMHNAPTSHVRGYAGIAYSLLLILGLVGFWAQRRGRLGRASTAGILLVFTSLLSLFLMIFLGTMFGVSGKTLVMNILALAFVFLLPPGFILLGIGLSGVARVVAFAIVGGFLAWAVLPKLVALYYPPAAQWWGRGDSPFGMAFFFLVAIGLAIAGYSVFRKTATGSTTDYANARLGDVGRTRP